MRVTLGDRLQRARQARFVGRCHERALFDGMLDGSTAQAVLLLHGPGGIGKSALLDELAQRAEQRGRSVLRLDARDIVPSPAGVWQALRRAAGDDAEADASMPAWPDGLVLMIDTLEQIGALERWLREVCLPALPHDALVVLAGRQRPGDAWWSDAGWAALAQVHAVQALDGADAQAYLQARGVPAPQCAAAAALACGHPLALVLLADALAAGRHEVLTSPQERRALLQALAARLVDAATPPAQRRAVQLLVLARSVTAAMLAEVMGGDTEAAALWSGLRALPFVAEGEHGLVLHDDVRDALAASCLPADDTQTEALRLALMQHLARRMRHVGRADALRLAMDWLYLARDTPMGRFIDPAQAREHHTDTLRDDDMAPLLAMAARQHGAASAAVLRHWLRRQPEGVVVVRHRDGALVGAGHFVDLAQLQPDDAAADPAIVCIQALRGDRPPADAGTHAWVLRMLVQHAGPDFPSPVFQLLSLQATARWLLDPWLAWSAVLLPSPERLDPLFASFTRFHWHRRPDALAFSLDGQRWGGFVRDWQAEPHPLWPPRTAGAVRPEQPDRDAFTRAVRDALKHCAHDEALRASPLMACQQMRGRAGDVAALRALLVTVVDDLARHPRALKFHHALRLTWLDPGASQEAVAAELGLPFNTYRYHLAKGVERVADALWQRELAAGGETAAP